MTAPAGRLARVVSLLDATAVPGDTAWFRAPGRVNVMGDHTDYNEGFVLPMAIDRDCIAAVRPRSDGRVLLSSAEFPDDRADLAADGTDDPRAVSPPWARLVAGVVRALAGRGRPSSGAALALSSNVPIGSGLASSAALEVAAALALAHAADWTIKGSDLALACRDAEHEALGVPCGVMDQLVAVAAREGSAMLIDCRSLAWEHVAVPAGLAVVAVHSGRPRTLASSAYADRRVACEAAAGRIGVRALRDATLEQAGSDPYARHVVTENARALSAARALQTVDLERLAALFTASHGSLRDDFAVSTPELDLLVDALTSAGAIGARLTGAGFGGCVVALIERGRVSEVLAAATQRYAAGTGLVAQPYICRPAGGAGSL